MAESRTEASENAPAAHPAVEWLVTSFLALLIAVAAIAVLEGASRLVHRGERPLVPVQHLQGTYSSLYPNSVMTAVVPGEPGVEYVTNAVRARVASLAAAQATADPDVLVLGDSQAMGWGLPFEATAGARLAEALTGTANSAQLLASPGVDPETALHSLRAAASQWSSKPQVLVIYVNFGNDLDEVYIARAGHHFSNMTRFNEWLGAWSYAALDIAKLSGAFDLRNKLGVNEVLFQTTAEERIALSAGIVQAVDETSKVFGDKTRVVVVVIPNDYQFDVREFAKYEGTYTNKVLYGKYQGALPAMKADMDAAYNHCIEGLRRLGLNVVDVGALKGRPLKQPIYDRWSHHLSAYGNELVAAEALRFVGTPAMAAVGKTGDAK